MNIAKNWKPYPKPDGGLAQSAFLEFQKAKSDFAKSLEKTGKWSIGLEMDFVVKYQCHYGIIGSLEYPKF